jgi:ppGpp synthetase/RelA/SpoT-type nucleotidyltranferase
MEVSCPSKSQVAKAGSTLRKWLRDELGSDDDRVVQAYDCLLNYRAAYTNPLASANMGLRSMVKSAGCQVEVSQRLKRVPTILDKLQREPTLSLSNMQDVGGVRAVLDTVADIRRVESRIKKNRPLVGYSDYIVHPRESGYRGVHLVVDYRERHIEIQLRTRTMHDWAVTVERISGRVGLNLKQDGQHAIQDLMRAISDAMAIEENGGIVDEAKLREIGMLRARANPYLAPGGSR